MREILREFKTQFQSYYDSAKKVIRWRKAIGRDEAFYIESAKADSNLHRIILFTLLVFGVQISNFIADMFGGFEHRPGWYVSVYLYLMAVSTVFFIVSLYFLAKGRQNHDSFKVKKVYLSFWFFFSLGSLFFTVLDLTERNSVTNYIILLAVTAVVPVFDIIEFLTIAFLDFLFIAAFIVALKKDFYFLEFCFALTFSTCAISQCLFYSYISTKLLQRRLKQYAETDALTELPNRHGLNEWIIRAKPKWSMQKSHGKTNEKSEIALGIIDIDYFKDYNDKFGHLNGDECLKTIAKCLKNFFDQESNIVCRFGGEEFVVILSDITKDDAFQKFVEVKSRIQREAGYHLNTDMVTVSIGVAFANADDHINLNEVLQRADTSLYAAKENGKNLVISDDGRKVR